MIFRFYLFGVRKKDYNSCWHGTFSSVESHQAKDLKCLDFNSCIPVSFPFYFSLLTLCLKYNAMNIGICETRSSGIYLSTFSEHKHIYLIGNNQNVRMSYSG